MISGWINLLSRLTHFRTKCGGRHCAAILAGSLMIVGCHHADKQPDPKKDDPLLSGLSGGGPPPAYPPPAQFPTAPAAAPPAQPAQPTASASPSTSNAALASDVLQPRETDRDKRLQLELTGQTKGKAPEGAILGAPQPIKPVADARKDPLPASGGIVPVAAVPPSSPPAASPRIYSYDQAMSVLTARGVIWRRLENTSEGWKFSCSVPNRTNPTINRTYEAQAGTDLAAIQAVIDQMDREQVRN